MKKKIFDFALLALGGLSIVFAIVCFIFGGTAETFTGVGSFSAVEAMFIDLVVNTFYFIKCASFGFGAVLFILGGILIIKALKKILPVTED